MKPVFSIFMTFLLPILAFAQESDYEKFENEFNYYIQEDSLNMAINALDGQLKKLDMWYHAYALTQEVKLCLELAHKKDLQDFRNQELKNDNIEVLGRALQVSDRYLDEIINGEEDTYHSTLSDLDYVRILNDYGFFLDEVKQHEEAIAVLKKVIEFDSTRTVAYLNLADALWNVGIKDSASVEEMKECYKIYFEQCKAKGLTDKVPDRVLERIGE